MFGDFGSVIRSQQSAQADRDQANQAVQNMRNRFANMGPAMTQLPISGPYAGNYGQPFARQAPMMDMRGIGGLLAGLLGGARGGYGRGYSPQGPQYGQPRLNQRYIPQGDAYMRGPMSDEQRAQSQARLSARMQELGLSPDDRPGYAAPPSFQPLSIQDQQRAAAADDSVGGVGITTKAPALTQPQMNLAPPQFGFGQPQGGFQAFQPRSIQEQQRAAASDDSVGGVGITTKAPPFQGGFGQPQGGFQQLPSQGGFGQPPMGGAPGGKGGAKGGGTFGQPSYGMQARYSSPFGNLF
jgi:hypothetical protein